MYYLLSERNFDEHPARLLDSNSINDGDLWWDDGVSFEAPPPTPVKAALEPFNKHNPAMSEEFPEAFYEHVPFFREDLIRSLSEAGVTNLDLYDAEITDPDSGKIYTNYKAVNLIGMHTVADFKRSIADIHDGIAKIDVSFSQLVTDPQKLSRIDLLLFRLEENNGAVLVHQSVKDHLQREGFKLEYYELESAHI